MTIENVTVDLQLDNKEIKKIYLSSLDTELINSPVLETINNYLKSFIQLKNESFFINDSLKIKDSSELRDKYESEIVSIKNEISSRDNLIETLKTQHANEINILQMKLNQFMLNMDGIIHSKVNDELKHVKSSFEIKEDFYKNTIQELKQNNNTLSEIQKNNELIMNILTRPKSNIEIGNAGESFVQNIISNFTKYHTTAKIENVSGSYASGDLKFVYDKMICCVEVKNIRDDIGNNHIDKFIRDLDNSTHNYNCGLFVSIRSGFSIKSSIEDLQIHIINNKPIIYICNLQDSPDKLIMCINLLNRLVKLIETSSTYEANYFLEQIKIHLDQLNSMESHLKSIVLSVKAIQETIINSKKSINKLLCLENTNDSEIALIETPCGLKKYKGITKNYKAHITTCSQCLSLQIHNDINNL